MDFASAPRGGKGRACCLMLLPKDGPFLPGASQSTEKGVLQGSAVLLPATPLDMGWRSCSQEGREVAGGGAEGDPDYLVFC